MDTANIGKAKAADPINQEPGQPVAPEPAEQRASESEQKAAETPAQEPDPHAAARRDIAKLSREGLEDEVIGLREENAELRGRVSAQRSQIADLKAQVHELTSSEDTGRKIGNLQRRISVSEGRSKEHQAAAARLQRQVNAQKAEIAKLRGEREAV